MLSLKLPLEISKDGLARQSDLKKSIDSFVETLATTSLCHCAADPGFGFGFNNFAFENFNETDGTVANSEISGNKKVSGNSRSVDTFASDFCEAVKTYEKRLDNVMVSMSYVKEERVIFLDVKGKVKATGEPYWYETRIKLWK